MFRKTCSVLAVLAAALLLALPHAFAERIKDLVAVQGVRSNALLGYGLVVGLDGTGDQTTQTPFTVQSLGNMLSQLGITLPSGSATGLQLKNVAAVMVTANLAAFARPGQAMDVTVSSLGNAKSLRGGTLLLTPLKGADGQVYALAQGNVLVGGIGASSAGGTSVTVNHLSVGRISGGATVERMVPTYWARTAISRSRLIPPTSPPRNTSSLRSTRHSARAWQLPRTAGRFMLPRRPMRRSAWPFSRAWKVWTSRPGPARPRSS